MNSWKTTASYRSLWNEDKRINFKVILNFKYKKKEADYIYIHTSTKLDTWSLKFLGCL